MKVQLSRVISARETTHGKLLENPALLVMLIEPTIEYIMKSIFKDLNQVSANCFSFFFEVSRKYVKVVQVNLIAYISLSKGTEV